MPTAPPLLVGLGHDALALVTVLVVALLVGVPLGALAGSGPRWVDVGLAFTTDWIAAVPVVLLMAFVRPAGVSHLGGLLLLGALRSLEVAWVVRSALLRAAQLDTTWAARSLGYMPLTIFLNQRLPAAARPALTHLALTPVWTFLLDGVGAAAGLGAASSEKGLGALVVRPETSATTAALAISAVVALTMALHRQGLHYGLRLARK
ncbi:MAG TPA: ABC transporter permease subunit [Polyangiaceae bacterium]|nr:ABC transporter permease subunit [Polyangiaceae bacterium]